MRRWGFFFFCIFIFSTTAEAKTFPTPQGYVNDFAGVITPAAESQLESWAQNLSLRTGVEVAIATVSDLEGEALETYAVDLFAAWGIGKKGKDNGLLILVVPPERALRIEVGYGLEGLIPDALAGRVARDSMFPFFREGDYSAGLMAGATALMKIVGDEYGVELQGLPVSVERPIIKGTQRGLGSFIFKILFALVMLYLFIRHPLLFLFFLSSLGRGSGMGGGFSRGGFGGFGGGLSGGGGFSGRW